MPSKVKSKEPIPITKEIPIPKEIPITIVKKPPTTYKSIKMQEFNFEPGVGEQQTLMVRDLMNTYRSKPSSAEGTIPL